MSFKKSKLDLLVRVRYLNPLPAPPCPPKLLDIPTNPIRYAKPEFLNSLATNTLLPMIVDAECGMPLDLGKWESLWEEGADDSALNPDIDNLPKLDPKDEFLAFETPTTTGGSSSYHSGGNGLAGPSIPAPPVAPVSWLRKTEYISRADVSHRASGQESKSAMLEPIDVSRGAQLNDIEVSFKANNEDFSLEDLRHPNKPATVKAVESFEILPDVDIWANQYDLFRFSERPGERTVDVEDPRLDCAILRPVKTDHDSFLSYYLTADDAIALKFKAERARLAPYQVPPNEEETIFNFARDYETVKVEQEVPNEFLLVLDDGTKKEEESKGRPKGAYYKNIERKMFLKKRRAVQFLRPADYQDRWDIIRVTHATMSKEEEDERQEALAEVVDPLFLMRAEADAEGEMEVEVDDGTQEASSMMHVDV